MKKFYSTLALLSLSLCLAIPAFAAEEPIERYSPYDIEGHWAQAEIENFVKADLIRGNLDAEGYTDIRPDDKMTRAEFAVMLVNIAGLSSDEAGKEFKDVKKGVWYSNSIRIASALGIVNGVSPTEFGVTKIVTRAEMATMIVRAYEAKASIDFKTGATKFKDVPSNYFAAPYIEKASATGLIGGTSATTFSPKSEATRAQVIVVLNRAVMLEKKNLPAEAELVGIVQAANKEIMDQMNAGKIDQINWDKYYTGFEKVDSLESISQYQEVIAQGATIKYEIVAEENLKVVKSSDRFAVVQSTGGKIRVTATNGDRNMTDVMDADGSYYLMKTTDGTWKMYMSK
ncbi:hypothetical protein SD71_15400 [Cohnella kolymensis]|uniref:SLH domain-containing protein n=1 Tax=Cohnella kolymensis TaxID=1590652 RepID=A0ABR5A221_9BACL|nr:S-layer homology domain-containing protein [Cohnella kolymensis]KIL35046.1 hypothetical protein SD71_15400 [Cohnella kolymensis]